MTDPIYPTDCRKWDARKCRCPEYGKNPHHVEADGPPCLGRTGVLECFEPVPHGLRTGGDAEMRDREKDSR